MTQVVGAHGKIGAVEEGQLLALAASQGLGGKIGGWVKADAGFIAQNHPVAARRGRGSVGNMANPTQPQTEKQKKSPHEGKMNTQVMRP
ncbi:hypothetical protein GCM10011375_16830 [Hymenobacter qilianensis]|uniref:Uncharacterized protein n=1 Tax=Hymenobacter qilianensis TaxID=1385715 RepID=A0ACB5PQM1_9BACT|nr:hypothetical protein GCM10011375_16830 [Hymenobacter qilianensis]